MAETKVSNLIRVRQGKSTVEFELRDGKLTTSIDKKGSGQLPFSITINEEVVGVLKEMLGRHKASSVLATKLPPDVSKEEEEHPKLDLEADGDTKEGMA